MNSQPREGTSVLVLADGPYAPSDLPDAPETTVVDPAVVEERTLAAVDVSVVSDRDGLDRIRTHDRCEPVIAFVDDPTGAVATAPDVDAVATTPKELEATVEWLVARETPQAIRGDPSLTPSRIEQLNAGATRLASVRTTEEAHRAAIAVADEVFPAYHCVVGVRDGEWIEPIAASADVPVEDCNRVRVGEGSAGTVVETGTPAVAPSSNAESPYDTLLTMPVGDDTVLQLVTAGSDGFTERDRRLAELLASHVEETLDRIRTDEALRSERDHLLALFSNVPDPAVAYDYVDGDPVVYRVNEAFEETFGYDAETVVGESVDDYIVPASDEAVEEATELNSRLHRGESVRREVTRETTDGPRHFILHVVPVRLDAENVSGYAIYTDVTDRRERESTLERQNDRLDEFASIVSHDLRNPLSVAEGYVELARETGDPEHFERAANALDRMDELVGDLLSLARQGESVGETEPLSLETIAREAWAGVDTDGAELVVEGDVTLDANPSRTRELLENLFRNSVEHGAAGGRAEADDAIGDGRDRSTAAADPLTVRVGGTTFRGGRGSESETAGGFFVEDDGRGLPEDDVDRVFESGFSTDETGTGLGLAISKRIAEAHGWNARALGGETGGARFEFRTE